MEDSTLQYVNYLLVTLIFLSIGRRLFYSRNTRSPSAVAAADEPTFKTYTPRTLAPFTGAGGPGTRVLMGVRGDVFDVSAGRSFYGPGGPYSNFAGRDASRGLAKNSFDEEMLTPLDQKLDKLEDLTDEERKALDGWHDMFSGKYILVGKLVNEE